MIIFSCPNWQIFIINFFLIKLRNFYYELCE